MIKQLYKNFHQKKSKNIKNYMLKPEYKGF